jgi:hypothetical protein
LYGEEVDGEVAAAGGGGEETPLIQVARRGRVDRSVEEKGGLGERAWGGKSSAIGGGAELGQGVGGRHAAGKMKSGDIGGLGPYFLLMDLLYGLSEYHKTTVILYHFLFFNQNLLLSLTIILFANMDLSRHILVYFSDRYIRICGE